MTLRGLARGSALYTLGFLLPRLGSFLLLPIYVRFLSPADFGAVALVTMVASLLAILFRGGLDAALMRLHFQVEPEERPRVYTTAITTSLLVALTAGTVAALASALFFERLFAGLAFAPFGLLALSIAFASTFHSFPGTRYRAEERPGRFVAYTSATFALTAAVTIVLVVGGGLGATGAILGQLAGGLFGVTVAALSVVRAGGLRVDRGVASAALRFGLPLVPHALAGWLLNISDRWLLSLLLPGAPTEIRAEIGVYSFGYQLGFVVALLAQAFNSAWTPFFYRYGRTDEGPRIHREMVTIGIAGFSAIAVAVALLAPEIVAVMARPAFADAAAVTPLVAAASALFAGYFLVVTVVFFSGRTAMLPAVTGVAAAVNVAANLVLVPVIGILGAAWATVAGYGAMALLTYGYARRVYPITLDAARLPVLGAAGAAAVAAGVQLGAGGAGDWTALRVIVGMGFATLAVAASIGPARRLRALTRSAARGLSRAAESEAGARHDQVGGA